MDSLWKAVTAGTTLATLLACLIAPATAREILDRSDPALANATSVILPPVGTPSDATSFEVTAQGVTFRFESTSGEPLTGFGGPGIVVVPDNSAGTGVIVTVSPPVPAIAFDAMPFDGFPGGLFVGATGVEEIVSSFATSIKSFYGATDIGAIGTVDLRNGPDYFRVTEMVFAGGGAGGAETADLLARSSASSTRVLENSPVQLALETENLGPDDAADTQLTALFNEGTLSVAQPVPGQPTNNSAVWSLGDLPAGTLAPVALELMTPDRSRFSCNSRLTTVTVAGSATTDPNLSNNLSVSSVGYDAGAGSVREVCGNGIDDDCDGRFDCADSDCDCRPVLPPGPGADDSCVAGIFEGVPDEVQVQVVTCGGTVTGGPGGNNANNHSCTVPRGRCGGVTVPAFCCDPSTWSNPSNNASASIAQCDVGVPGCAPVDPNFKTALPTTNIAGFGFADAGETITYTIQYENIGNADALNVEIIDVLDPDLDDSTLVIENAGSYDPATRTLRWTDPVLPPNSPRTVSFRVGLRADAEAGTRARNEATIVFPNAVPPSRVDTNFVEHVVPGPRARLPLLSVLSCEEVGPDEWRVNLLNERQGFAYNARATIFDPPAAILPVSDATATFAHTDDPLPAQLGTVVPNAFTPSSNTVRFDTQTPSDPCPALQWEIRWETLQGVETVAVVQREPDIDRDAVPDAIDNCPGTYNPTQADVNGDGTGDACSQAPVGDLLARGKGNKVSLVWTPIADASSYTVLRRTGTNGELELLASQVVTDFATYLDTDVTTGETYSYVVRWVDAAGTVSPDSNTATVLLRGRGRR